jgi:two-component system nitrogen regulation response regulator NtrX
MDKFRAIVVDDEPSVCEAVKAILELEGVEVTTFLDSRAAAEDIKKNGYDLIISDLKMPTMTGLELYDAIREAGVETTFIIITAFGTISSAVDAVKRGVWDYIPKPFTPDEVRLPVRRALEKRRLERENLALRSQVEMRYSFQNIIGNSPEIREMFRIMRHAASSESNVLITGESGTGKELVARAVHSNSVRVRRKFVTVNCGAIPDGLIESELFGHAKGSFTSAIADKKGLVEEADRGTLFLDEIGELTAPLQVKLLRVLQEGEFTRIGETQTRKVNVRVIAATNKDLEDAIQRGEFREDLYFRLNVIPILVPPLRDRRDDIPPLVQHFARLIADEHNLKPKRFDAAAMDALSRYRWRGNIRELRNTIERLLIMAAADVVQIDDLPREIRSDSARPAQPEASAGPTATADAPAAPAATAGGTGTLREFKDAAERAYLVQKLRENNWNISKTAEVIDTPRSNLYKKLEQYGIKQEIDG